MNEPTDYIATTTVRGQIVIPAALRRKFGIRDGTRVRIREHGDTIVLEPLTDARLRALRGSLRGTGVLEALIEDRAAERDR